MDHIDPLEGIVAEELSVRELAVLRSAAEGLTDKAIAYRLGISIGTVNTYWARIRQKLGHKNRVELAAAFSRERAHNKLTHHMERQDAELRETYARLAASEARYGAIVDSLIAAVITISEDGHIEWCSKATERIFGYKPSELVGEPVTVLMSETLGARHQDHISQYCKTGIAKIIGIGREVEGKRKTGETFAAYLAISELWIDEKRFFTGIIHDVSDRKIAQTKLKESEALQATLLEAAVDSIVWIDERGVILGCNGSAERTFGYAKEEIVGKKVNVLMPEPDSLHHDEYISRYLDTGQARIIGIGRRVKAKRKNGAHFDVHLSVGHGLDHGLPVFVAILHEIKPDADERTRW